MVKACPGEQPWSEISRASESAHWSWIVSDLAGRLRPGRDAVWGGFNVVPRTGRSQGQCNRTLDLGLCRLDEEQLCSSMLAGRGSAIPLQGGGRYMGQYFGTQFLGLGTFLSRRVYTSTGAARGEPGALQGGRQRP